MYSVGMYTSRCSILASSAQNQSLGANYIVLLMKAYTQNHKGFVVDTRILVWLCCSVALINTFTVHSCVHHCYSRMELFICHVGLLWLSTSLLGCVNNVFYWMNVLRNLNNTELSL